MNYRNLGRTGVKVSPLCLGTMNFGYRTPEADAITIIQRALDDGINFIDTANFYGQPANDGRGQGITETIVGKAIKSQRERVVLATKVFLPTADYPEDPNAYGISRRSIFMECEKSLTRLDTDYIDLYQLHRPQLEIPIDETLRALDDLITSGKVRYIGTSKFPAWQIVEALWVSDKHHLNRFVTEQPRYNLLMRDIESELVQMALAHNIAILPYSPLAGGILTGKYKAGESFSEDSRMADDAWGNWAQSFLAENVQQKVEALAEIAAEKNCTVSQLALAWTMQQPAITSIIIGPRTLAHYVDNLGALNVELTEEEVQRINDIF